MFYLQLFGWPGVGKETIANLVAKNTDAFVFRNHYAVDVAFSMLSDDGVPDDDLWDEVAVINEALENIAFKSRSRQSIIFTNYLTEDPSEWDKLNRRKRAAKKNGASFYLVRLDCEEQENKRRLQSVSRSGGKMKNPEILASHKKSEKLIQAETADVIIDLKLDVSALSPDEAATKILKLLPF